jgi:hypothetical protein
MRPIVHYSDAPTGMSERRSPSARKSRGVLGHNPEAIRLPTPHGTGVSLVYRSHTTETAVVDMHANWHIDAVDAVTVSFDGKDLPDGIEWLTVRETSLDTETSRLRRRSAATRRGSRLPLSSRDSATTAPT